MEKRLSPSTTLAWTGVQLLGVVLGAVLWTFIAPVGGSYDLEFREALIVVALPGFVLRALATRLALAWGRSRARRGAAAPWTEFIVADVLLSVLLAGLAFPVVLLAYFVYGFHALTLLMPPVPLASACVVALLERRRAGASDPAGGEDDAALGRSGEAGSVAAEGLY